MSTLLDVKSRKLAHMDGQLDVRIEYILKTEGISAAELPRVASVSPTAVMMWRSGETKVLSTEPALNISKRYNYKINWLLSGVGAVKEPLSIREPHAKYTIDQTREILPDVNENSLDTLTDILNGLKTGVIKETDLELLKTIVQRFTGKPAE